MQIQKNADLKGFHTFGIETKCDFLVEIASVDELIELFQQREWQHIPKLIIGKGSNMLFTQPFQGMVIVNRILGRTIKQSEHHYHLHIGAGEDWPEMVEWSLSQGVAGLENLAQIPGCVGSSPIQNIGAYGIELQDVCEYVDYLCLKTLEIKRLSTPDCLFGYRDSIFKHQLHNSAIIVAVGLVLEKDWQPRLSYGPLKAIASSDLTPQKVFETVSRIRHEKLPDPSLQGNAGSFFKNPVISLQQFESLKRQFPSIVGHQFEGGMKIAAGWLIDHADLKGVSVGGAMVHPKQALVLINSNNASAKDILLLAQHVKGEVLDRYDIELEHEVRFMGSKQETSLAELEDTLS